MSTDIRLRMPREKWEAIEKARADLRRAKAEVDLATERLREAERAAGEVAMISVR